MAEYGRRTIAAGGFVALVLAVYPAAHVSAGHGRPLASDGVIHNQSITPDGNGVIHTQDAVTTDGNGVIHTQDAVTP
jgi:hypothetical protein